VFTHILVPTDFTEKSERAMDIAVRMALQDGSRLTLLHVIEIIEDTEAKEFEDFYEKLGKRAQKKMQRMLEPFKEHALEIRQEILYGNRVTEIVKYAAGNTVDLIVLSSHKIDPSSMGQGWGTISYKVGVLAPCPVMMIK